MIVVKPLIWKHPNPAQWSATCPSTGMTYEVHVMKGKVRVRLPFQQTFGDFPGTLETAMGYMQENYRTRILNCITEEFPVTGPDPIEDEPPQETSDFVEEGP